MIKPAAIMLLAVLGSVRVSMRWAVLWEGDRRSGALAQRALRRSSIGMSFASQTSCKSVGLLGLKLSGMKYAIKL